MTTLIRSNFDLDVLMAARCAYYVLNHPFLADDHYDALEKEYELVYGELPPGSSNKTDYTEAQRSLALYFTFSGRKVPKEDISFL